MEGLPRVGDSDLSTFYYLVEQLGSGAQSQVYLGQSETGDQFAIKIFVNNGDSSALEAAASEIEVMSGISHPGIV